MVRTLPEAELFVDARARLGEGPVWDARVDRLVWVDIEGMAIHSTDPGTGATPLAWSEGVGSYSSLEEKSPGRPRHHPASARLHFFLGLLS